MTANQIPGAAVDALYDELFRVGRYLHAPVPIDPKEIIRRHLTAAQQQRQAEPPSAPVGVDFAAVAAILRRAMRDGVHYGYRRDFILQQALALEALSQQPAAVAVDEGSRSVAGQLLHWGGVPVRVTGTVTTLPGNWSLIDAALATQEQEGDAQMDALDRELAEASEALWAERAEWKSIAEQQPAAVDEAMVRAGLDAYEREWRAGATHEQAWHVSLAAALAAQPGGDA